jgi:hypothetical protein
LKVFISSRRDGDIRTQLEKQANVEISAIDNQNDISSFVAHAIGEHLKSKPGSIPKRLQEKIVATIHEKSGGM